MQFVLYSEKTVAQCMTAINARMQVKETASRPALDGWVEKGGAFSLSLSTPVIGRFSRRTALQAKVERESGITVIRGSVPNGASRQNQAIVFAALALVALIIFLQGNPLIALLLLPFAAYLYIPMHGDFVNSAALMDEVQKTLKAKTKPPKKTVESKSTATVRAASSTAKPASRAAAKASVSAASKPATARAAKETASVSKAAAPRAAAKPASSAAPRTTAARPPAAAKTPAPRKIPQGPEDEFPPMSGEQA